MNKKFLETNLVADWEVKTEDGYKDVVTTHKTEAFAEYHLKTTSHELLCADKHIVFKTLADWVYTEDLKEGDTILTEDGPEMVTYCEPTGERKEMYDLQVNHTRQSYYTNGILSHNTATAALYLLWYGMFNPDKNILVTSYKWDAVNEVMDRIRYAYQECPDYLRAGVTTYSSKKVVFDNNSAITAQTISENTGRGLSISLLYCLDHDVSITVKDKETSEVKNIPIGELYQELNDDMMMGLSGKPKLRLQFTDSTFMDVDEDTTFTVNGINTTIENIIKGDQILFGDDELEIFDIYMLDADGQCLV